jgi:hypothetical protein
MNIQSITAELKKQIGNEVTIYDTRGRGHTETIGTLKVLSESRFKAYDVEFDASEVKKYKSSRLKVEISM